MNAHVNLAWKLAETVKKVTIKKFIKNIDFNYKIDLPIDCLY